MDVGEMLRVLTSLDEILKSENLNIKQVNLWRRLKFSLGPTGGYIRWTWSLCSPCILLVSQGRIIFCRKWCSLLTYSCK